MREPSPRRGLDKTKVAIFASLHLIGESLRALLDSDIHLQVVGVARDQTEINRLVADSKPDVVLLCLMEVEAIGIDLISSVSKTSSAVRIVVLSCPNSLQDQCELLKSGVKGIVGANQGPKTLIRAIRQVLEGDVWLSQKTLEQLLNGDSGNGSEKNNGHHSPKAQNLTKRELEIIQLIGLGMNNKEISSRLSISEATVRHHLSSIYSKLYIEDRLNLAIFAYRNGIVASERN